MNLSAIGQISRSVRDINESIDWYGSKLGLPHLFTFGKLSFFDCGGTRLFLEESADLGSTAVLYFRVPNIQAAHAELAGKGVTFLGEPHLIHRHADGMEEWMAFFNDPEGRPLAIMSQVPPAASPSLP